MHTKNRDRAYWSKIWNDFKAGDRKSFEIIYNEFVDILYSYGSKITGDNDLVKDSIQDLFVDVFHYSIDLRKPEYLELYLLKSLKRIIISKLKINDRHMSLDDNYHYSFSLTFDLEGEYIREESEKKRFESLKKMLGSLAPEKRELLFLRFHTGLSYIQIAEILNMKPDAVKKQVYRLLSQIREEYGSRLLELLLIFLK